MNRFLILPALAVILAACSSGPKNVVVEKPVNIVVTPDENMRRNDRNCPQPIIPPVVETLTERDLTLMLVDQYNANRTCAATLDAVWEFLDRAEACLEREDPDDQEACLVGTTQEAP